MTPAGTPCRPFHALRPLFTADEIRARVHAMADTLARSAGVSEPDLERIRREAPLLVAQAAESERLDWAGEIEIHWRAYLLDPTATAEPQDLESAINRKYGPGAFSGMKKRLGALGEAEGIAYNFDTAVARAPDDADVVGVDVGQEQTAV